MLLMANKNRFLILLFSLTLILSLSALAAEPPFLLPPQKELNKLRTAIIYTNKGNLRFELFPEDAPWHVANMKFLADKGYFKGLSFSYFYTNYIIQSAGRKNQKWVTYTLPPEFSERQHKEGTLGMARKPDEANPERRSDPAQFHILLNRSPHMNGSYTIFGQLIDGFKVLHALKKSDQILDVKVFVRVEDQMPSKLLKECNHEQCK